MTPDDEAPDLPEDLLQNLGSDLTGQISADLDSLVGSLPLPAEALPPVPPRPRSARLNEGAHLDGPSPVVPIPSLMEDANAIVQSCRNELKRHREGPRAARLHCEIAQAFEDLLRDLDAAARHYDKALLMASDYVPAIRGARRLALGSREYGRALPLFDAEARLISDPKVKAMLQYQRARVLESNMQRTAEARRTYLAALSLDPTNLSTLKAMERLAVHASEWEELWSAYERAANAVTDDDALRAALLVKRARLAEQRMSDTAMAAELCESALRLAPNTLGAIETLERLYRQRSDWGRLISVLERRAAQAKDVRERAQALHDIGRVHSERLGSRAEALDALRRAAHITEYRDRLILDDLAHLCAISEDYKSLVEVLRAQYAIAESDGEKVAFLHRVGHIHERYLSNEDEAIRCHTSALQLDPTHVPTLQALATLHSRRGEWAELVQVHLTEAGASTSVKRRAAVHGRIAVILEDQLGRLDEAAEHHERALSLQPDATASFKALLRLHGQAGRYRELVEVYERGLDQTGDITRQLTCLFKIGSLWEGPLNDPIQACHAYRRVLDLDPENLGAIHDLQRASERAGRHRELVAALELEVKLSQENEIIVALLHRIGSVLDERLGDREAAMLRFKEALKLAPRYLPVLATLGRMYYRAGRWHDLLAVYEQELISHGPGKEAVILLQKMGELSEQKLGSDVDAIKFYRRAAGLDPSNKPAIRALQRKLRELGMWSELLDAIELELKSEDEPYAQTVLWYSLGQIHEERMDRADRAISAYERALTITPDYWPAQLALTQLHSQQGAWEPLMGDMEAIGRASNDPQITDATLLRRGEIARDQLQDPARALHYFEALLKGSDTGQLPALLALESLYEEVGNWEALASVYLAQAASITDGGARIAALRELARVQQSELIASPGDISATYEAILSISPNDTTALMAMHQLVHEQGQEHAEVYRRLADTADDDGLAARYYASMGHVIESGAAADVHTDDPAEAIADANRAYRAALARDRECMAAIRGLARTAGYLGDHQGRADAAQLESQVVQDPETSAQLLVRSARIRLEELGDTASAVTELERALHAWPDTEWAAQRIREPLLAAGQIDRLIDILSRAANGAKNQRTAANHWLAVADLHLNQRDDLERGLTCLHRALRSIPDHIPTLQRLADAYVRDRRFDDAIKAHEKIVELSTDVQIKSDAYLKLARVWSDGYRDLGMAMDSLTRALELTPNHWGALAQLSEWQLLSRNPRAALDTAQRMVSVAHDTNSRVKALLHRSRIERECNEVERAELSLSEALTLQGPGGEADAAYQHWVKDSGDWTGYANALRSFIQRTPASRDRIKQAYLELARVQGDRRGSADRAVTSLEEAQARMPDDHDIARELANRLRTAGRPDEALALWHQRLDRDIADTGAWRGVIDALEDAQRTRQALMAVAPLMILNAADSDERQKWRTRKARPGEASMGALAGDSLRKLASDDSFSRAAAELLAVLGHAMPRLHRPDLDGLGLSKRARVSPRSQRPIRALNDKLAAIFDIEYELYLHPRSTPVVSYEMTEPISIILAEHVTDQSEARQVFTMAMAMAPIAGRYVTAEKLTRKQLEVALTAAARTAVPGFSGSVDDKLDEDELDHQAQRIKKALPRRFRKALDSAGIDYAAEGGVSIESWYHSLRRVSLRAALLVCDDLVSAAKQLREIDDLMDYEGPALLRESPALVDLIRYWISDDANDMRRLMGMRT